MEANEIKALRLEKNLTQEQLGEFCGVKKSAVSAWEKGTRNPTGSALIQLERLKKGENPFSDESVGRIEEENKINISFTDEEYALVEKAARLCEEETRSFIRRAAIAKAREKIAQEAAKTKSKTA